MIMREQYEWCNYWWEEANDGSKPRVLLVGDSIAAGYRPYVNALLKDALLADQYASSRSITDGSFMKELDHALSEYPYRLVHFNNGLHGVHVTIGEYRCALDAVISMISHKQPEARIVLATTTPVTVRDCPERINEETDRMVAERNRAVYDKADSLGLYVNDLYTPMLGKSALRVSDGYHYTEEGRKYQAEIVAAAIRGALAGNAD